jgi:cytochrome b6-f complex iron-sulfur subunit
MNTFLIAILVAGLVLLAGLVVLAAGRRRDTGEATGLLSRETVKRDAGGPAVLEDAEPRPTGKAVERAAEIERRGGTTTLVAPDTDRALAEYVPPDPDTIGVTRRQFFNRSIVVLMLLAISGFGAAVLAFLWPQPKGGFGSKIRVGNVSDVLAQVAANNGFLYVAEGRMWVTEFPSSAAEKAKAVYPQPVLNSMEAGVAVLYQKCPHLGCRVPECATSQWFECPCHGSQFNQAGEKKGGPAPRGMDRFSTEVSGGVLSVDTGVVIQGPPIGTNTTGQEAEGPHCVGAGSH